MPAINTKNPTLADVRLVTGQSSFFPENKRRRIDNALNSVWRYSGRRLEDIPATMAALREVIDSIEPAAHGIGRPTVINVRNYVMHAMKQSGLVPGVSGYMQRRKPLHPAWDAFMGQGLSRAEHNSLWSFVHFLNDREISPSNVDGSQYAAFVEHMAESSPRANLHLLIRAAAKNWNVIRAKSPGLNLQELIVPPSRSRLRSTPETTFPTTFREDRDAYLGWASSDDVFAENAREVVLKKSTISNYKNKLDRCVTVLIEAGIVKSKITSLGTLVEIDNFRKILRRLHAADTSSQRGETFGTAIMLIRMAKDWVRPDPSALKELEDIKRKLPKPKMIMTEKNKVLVSQFDDPAVLRRLFDAPDKIWDRLMKDKRLGLRSKLALAQAAIGIGILMTMPLRLSNLTALAFGKHIVLRHNGTSSIIIRPEETKSNRAIEFDIPDSLAAKLWEYHTNLAPVFSNGESSALFCRTDGAAKGFAQVRYLIQTYFKEYVGFHMNPHAFRHLSAKIILDANPGAHVMVQELLGHKNLQTAVAFYAGLNSRRAGRHHQELIAEAMARDNHSTARRRLKRA